MESYPRIISVEPQEHFKLRVVFTNGVAKLYDCARLWDDEAFQPLRNPAFFKNVRADAGGYGVVWNDQIDLSEAEIWDCGT